MTHSLPRGKSDNMPAGRGKIPRPAGMLAGGVAAKKRQEKSGCPKGIHVQ